MYVHIRTSNIAELCRSLMKADSTDTMFRNGKDFLKNIDHMMMKKESFRSFFKCKVFEQCKASFSPNVRNIN